MTRERRKPKTNRWIDPYPTGALDGTTPPSSGPTFRTKEGRDRLPLILVALGFLLFLPVFFPVVVVYIVICGLVLLVVAAAVLWRL